jgi:Smg protein
VAEQTICIRGARCVKVTPPMFDVLVYLYENYAALSACPDAGSLSRRLSDAGFDDDEIADAIGWLHGLASVTLSSRAPHRPEPTAFRVYTPQEYTQLGAHAIGFIATLDRGGQLNPEQREIVVERACALPEAPIALERLKIIVLMVLWSQSVDVDLLLLQELLDVGEPPSVH